jgi:hypothetical protein
MKRSKSIKYFTVYEEEKEEEERGTGERVEISAGR